MGIDSSIEFDYKIFNSDTIPEKLFNILITALKEHQKTILKLLEMDNIY